MTVTAWEPAITREPSCFRSCPLWVYVVTSPTGRRSDPLAGLRTGPDGSWSMSGDRPPKWRGKRHDRGTGPRRRWKFPGRHRWRPGVADCDAGGPLPGRRSPSTGKMSRSRGTDRGPWPLGERLASTGAAVIGVVVLGLLLVTLGLVAIVHRRQEEEFR